jgi:hypothetical protein
MDRFATVHVSCVEDKITCDPDVVQLYHLAGPDSVQWVIDSCPEGASGFQVSFQDESPFTDIGVAIGSGVTKLVATGNRMKKGNFKYTLRFLDSSGAVVAEVDPAITNDPLPPAWPGYP